MKATIAILTACLLTLTLIARAQDEKPAKDAEDKDIAADWKLLQGTWELLPENAARRIPAIQTLKTIEGNKETLRRYATDTGKMMHEQSVELQLTKSGSVRVCTFYEVGESPEDGMSFVYKVNARHLWEISGMLQGDEYRNKQKDPAILHWRRVVEGKDEEDAAKKSDSK